MFRRDFVNVISERVTDADGNIPHNLLIYTQIALKYK